VNSAEWLKANAPFLCTHFNVRLTPASCVGRQVGECQESEQNCYCTSRECAQGAQVARELVAVAKRGKVKADRRIRDRDGNAVAPWYYPRKDHHRLTPQDLRQIQGYLTRLGRARTELAAILNVPYMSLTDWMTGRSRMPPATYKLMVEVLRVKA